jgi:hypothetical protein
MPAVVVAAVLAVLYLVLDPPSADLAAQTYRAGLFGDVGFVVWDNHWYGGHHMPAYSVLLPPLGSWLGVDVVGALSIVAATAGLVPLARDAFPWTAATAAALWFAVAMTGAVVSGRLAFALGAAIGTAAVLAAVRERTWWAGALGVLTALASPVAALFTALVAAALWWHRRGPAAAALAGAAVATGALLALLFPEGGSEPFVASAFWPALAAAAIAYVLMPPGGWRIGVALYALVLLGAFAIDNPLGGNAARLGPLLGGALAIGLLWRRPPVLALVLVPLGYWVLYPPVRDVAQAEGDPARAASYYAPLLARIQPHPPTGRLEIPFTEGHWESARVAPHVPLARGWERQLDRKVNRVFYEGELTPERYRAWLADNAVRWVALPDAPLDYSARAEAQLIRGGLPYLRPLWRGEHWRLYAVRDATPLNVRELGHDWFTTTGGVVRLRWTPYWAVVAGRGCVREAPGGWTEVSPQPAGSEVRVAIRLDPLRALGGGERCR